MVQEFEILYVGRSWVYEILLGTELKIYGWGKGSRLCMTD